MRTAFEIKANAVQCSAHAANVAAVITVEGGAAIVKVKAAGRIAATFEAARNLRFIVVHNLPVDIGTMEFQEQR